MKLLPIEEEAAACRKAWKGSKAKLAWHLHHEVLAEPLTELAENRIAYILSDKPEQEQALRLRLFRPAKSRSLASANRAYGEATASADRAYDEATASADRAYDEALASAQRAYGEAIAPADRAYDEALASADRAYDEALASAQRAYGEALASAHSKECPGCPWNGESIFGGKK